MIEVGIIEALAAGGDLAAMALVLVMWRFDRRLLVLETRIVEGK